MSSFGRVGGNGLAGKRLTGSIGLAALLALSCPPAARGQAIHLRSVRWPNRISYWRQSGFVQMVPPVRLPTDRSIHEFIQVWLRIPAGKKVAVQWLAHEHRYTLKFPPGTVADRIDGGKDAKQAMFTVNGIADVRGATIAADGTTRWHVYEPVPGESSKSLRGYSWARIGPAGDSVAGDSLLALYYPGAPPRAKSEMATFFRLNQCTACHRANRPIPTTTMDSPIPATTMTGGFSFPETDADGFYQPITVLSDTMTVVNIRPWDLNAGDPYITVRCGKDRARLTTRGDAYRRYICPGHVVPVGTLHMAEALQHQDPHALEVCAARRYLYENMTAEGRKAFAPAFAECSRGAD